MKTAKIGAIFLVSVMALAGASAGYAWWTDHLYIKGEITTDTFGAEWGLESYPDTYFSHFIKWADGTNPAPDNPDYYDQSTGKPIGTENVDYWVIATGEIKLEDFAGLEYGETNTDKAKIEKRKNINFLSDKNIDNTILFIFCFIVFLLYCSKIVYCILL